MHILHLNSTYNKQLVQITDYDRAVVNYKQTKIVIINILIN